MIIKQFLVSEFFIQRLIFSLTENTKNIDFIPLKIKVNIFFNQLQQDWLRPMLGAAWTGL